MIFHFNIISLTKNIVQRFNTHLEGHACSPCEKVLTWPTFTPVSCTEEDTRIIHQQTADDADNASEWLSM